MLHKEILWPQRLGLVFMIACISVAAYTVFAEQPLALILLAPLIAALCKFVQLDARLNREFMTEKYCK